MRIENRTKWRTEDLRDMIGQALCERGVPSSRLDVIVAVARKPESNGRAQRGYWRWRNPGEAVRDDGTAPRKIFEYGADAKTRAKRAKTLETKWARRIAALERRAKR